MNDKQTGSVEIPVRKHFDGKVLPNIYIDGKNMVVPPFDVISVDIPVPVLKVSEIELLHEPMKRYYCERKISEITLRAIVFNALEAVRRHQKIPMITLLFLMKSYEFDKALDNSLKVGKREGFVEGYSAGKRASNYWWRKNWWKVWKKKDLLEP